MVEVQTAAATKKGMLAGFVLFLIRVAAVRGRINARINQSLDQSYSAADICTKNLVGSEAGVRAA
jgi:hypothetical protein